MGTNYYLMRGRIDGNTHLPETVHLGKSSSGWTFALHCIPECGICDLQDMVKWLSEGLGYLKAAPQEWPKIIDDNGQVHRLGSFLEGVTKRQQTSRISSGWDWPWYGDSYQSEEIFHARNHSERGPSGLLRRRIDGVHCVGHGSGTWDLCVGNFS